MNRPAALLEEIACFANTLTLETLPPKVVPLAKTFFADACACLLAGANEPATLIARQYAQAYGTPGVSTLLGSGGVRTDACSAAMVNGVALTYHEYDDINNTTIGHPSGPVLPAALALGEELDASGADVLLAYITGIEVYSLMGRAVSPEHNKQGWNATGSLGIFGAVGAAAKLLGLDDRQFALALAIAASESSGLKGNSGTMTKPRHAGRAAAKGILCARLAKLGFDANPEVLETKGGFADVTAGNTVHWEAVRDAIARRNSEFLDIGLTMKPWPSCRATHNGIDAMLRLLKEHDRKPEEIDEVVCTVLPYIKDIVRYDVVNDPTQGRFSMHYCLALAMVHRAVAMRDFEGTEILEPALKQAMEKVRVVVDDSGVYFDQHGKTTVELRCKDGAVYSETVVYAKGEPESPLSPEEQEEKMRDCVSRALDPAWAARLAELVAKLDSLQQIRAFTQEIEAALLMLQHTL